MYTTRKQIVGAPVTIFYFFSEAMRIELGQFCSIFRCFGLIGQIGWCKGDPKLPLIFRRKTVGKFDGPKVRG